MEETTRPLVFVSYATPDRQQAESLAQELEKCGVRCWIAPRDVPPGHNYGEAILDGIEGTEMMLVLVSNHSNDSTFVAKEVERAVSLKKLILPVRLHDVGLGRRLQFHLADVQWFDLFYSEGSVTPMPRLLDAVRDRLRVWIVPDLPPLSTRDPLPSATAADPVPPSEATLPVEPISSNLATQIEEIVNSTSTDNVQRSFFLLKRIVTSGNAPTVRAKLRRILAGDGNFQHRQAAAEFLLRLRDDDHVALRDLWRNESLAQIRKVIVTCGKAFPRDVGLEFFGDVVASDDSRDVATAALAMLVEYDHRKAIESINAYLDCVATPDESFLYRCGEQLADHCSAEELPWLFSLLGQIKSCEPRTQISRLRKRFDATALNANLAGADVPRSQRAVLTKLLQEG